MYFFILFSFASIVLPFVFRSFSPLVFLLSCAASVVLMSAYVALLFRVIPRLREARRRLMVAIVTIVACMNALYFLNIIPPIPLALRDAAVAHAVERIGNTYHVLVEDEPFWQRFVPGQAFHANAGEKIFVYTAIFAPADLATTIVHDWQYFDETKQQWISEDRLAFGIHGGAETGYRGYSFKSRIEPGRWRVDVETTRGQVLGRVRFRVLPAEEPPDLKIVIK
jgi:hypothetical protein